MMESAERWKLSENFVTKIQQKMENDQREKL